MGCIGSKTGPASADGTLLKDQQLKKKTLNEYAALVGNTGDADLKVALAGLSVDGRRKLKEAIEELARSGSTEPGKTLNEHAAEVVVAGLDECERLKDAIEELARSGGEELGKTLKECAAQAVAALSADERKKLMDDERKKLMDGIEQFTRSGSVELGKRLNECVTLLSSASPVDLEAALEAFNVESRKKLELERLKDAIEEFALSGSEELGKTLNECAAQVVAALNADERKKLMDDERKKLMDGIEQFARSGSAELGTRLNECVTLLSSASPVDLEAALEAFNIDSCKKLEAIQSRGDDVVDGVISTVEDVKCNVEPVIEDVKTTVCCM